VFGKIIKFVAEVVDAFLKGLMPAIENIATPLQGIVNGFSSIFDSIFGSDKAMSGWEGLFGDLGTFLGETLMAALKGVEDVIKFIDNMLKTIEKKGVAQGIGEAVEDFSYGVGKFFVGPLEELTGLKILKEDPKERRLREEQDDVIITKRGDIVPVSPDDNIAAFKDSSSMFSGGGVNVSIDFSGMQLLINQATVEEAERFSEKLVDSFRNQLSLELERAGVR